MRKIKKSNKSKKFRGGNNIGGNCSDPNFSIYNTNLLKLFPYKGGKKTRNKRKTKRIKFKGGNLDVNDIYKNQEGPQY